MLLTLYLALTGLAAQAYRTDLHFSPIQALLVALTAAAVVGVTVWTRDGLQAAGHRQVRTVLTAASGVLTFGFVFSLLTAA